MLTIGDKEKELTSGRGGWTQRELYAEAKRRGWDVKSNWDKARLVQLFLEAQEKKELKEVFGIEEEVSPLHVEVKEKPVESKEPNPLREYSEYSKGDLVREVLKLGLDFGSHARKDLLYMILLGYFGRPVRIRKESVVGITLDETYELVKSNGLVRVKDQREAVLKLGKLFGVEFRIEEKPKGMPSLPLERLSILPCLYVRREYEALARKFSFPADKTDIRLNQKINSLLGVVKEVVTEKLWESPSPQAVRREIDSELPSPFIPDRVLYFQVTSYSWFPLTIDALIQQFSSWGRLEISVMVRRNLSRYRLGENSIEGLDQICRERFDIPGYREVFRLVKRQQLLDNKEVIESISPDAPNDPLTRPYKEIVFDGVNAGVDISGFSKSVRDLYRKMRQKRIGKYLAILYESPLAKDTAEVVGGFLAVRI